MSYDEGHIFVVKFVRYATAGSSNKSLLILCISFLRSRIFNVTGSFSHDPVHSVKALGLTVGKFVKCVFK